MLGDPHGTGEMIDAFELKKESMTDGPKVPTSTVTFCLIFNEDVIYLFAKTRVLMRWLPRPPFIVIFWCRPLRWLRV